jgi:hypothetical protein
MLASVGGSGDDSAAATTGLPGTIAQGEGMRVGPAATRNVLAVAGDQQPPFGRFGRKGRMSALRRHAGRAHPVAEIRHDRRREVRFAAQYRDQSPLP